MVSGRTRSEKKAAQERTRPLREAWDELRWVFQTVVIEVALNAKSQAAGAQAVQAMTECTRRLREIAADFPDDDEDGDEAV